MKTVVIKMKNKQKKNALTCFFNCLQNAPKPFSSCSHTPTRRETQNNKGEMRQRWDLSATRHAFPGDSYPNIGICVLKYGNNGTQSEDTCHIESCLIRGIQDITRVLNESSFLRKYLLFTKIEFLSKKIYLDGVVRQEVRTFTS